MTTTFRARAESLFPAAGLSVSGWDGLCDRCDLSADTMRWYKSGDREPKASVALRIAHELKTTVEYLWGELP